MKKFILLIAILSSFASGKNLVPLTDALRKEHNLTRDQLSGMQFFVSQDIILSREIFNKTEKIHIKTGTPGTFIEMPNENKVLVRFGAGDDYYLSFGVNPNKGGSFVLLASGWENGRGKVHYGGNEYFTDPDCAHAFLMVDMRSIGTARPKPIESGNEVAQKQADIPPLISVTGNSISFKDNNGNNAIDAFEKCKLRFEIKNTGKGEGANLKVKLTAKGNTGGISFEPVTYIPTIEPGETSTLELPITANANTENGSVTFKVKVEEPRGFGSDEVEVEIPTRSFISPLVKVVDYTVTSAAGNNLIRKQPFDLQVLVQNVKSGLAENAVVEMESPSNVVCFSGNEHLSLGTLKAGAKKEIIYSLIVSENYTAPTIPIHIRLSEKYGKYAEDKAISLDLNQQLSAGKITIKASPENTTGEIEVGSLSVDVDRNIPVTGGQKQNTYALIIGNEDYSSYQHDLSKEINVDYASNDAQIFKEYCIKTIGIPERQVKLLINATEGQMNQGLAWINNLAKIDNGTSELIFYYSGHGLPDEQSKEPYLVPVDVSGSDIKQGIKLADVYSRLTEFPALKVSVFLDACFSGGARNQSLVAMKGIKIKPKENMLSGNMVVFASSSGEESSGVFREKQHGYLTYYLLKRLQETKGDTRFSELAEYIISNVKKETALRGTIQTPQINYSSGLENKWVNWKLK